MATDTLEAQLTKDFNVLFNKANLRTVEVANILGVHRVTVSRFKNHGIVNCEDAMLSRLDTLIKIVKKALAAKDLPLEDKDIRGKKNRVVALRTVIKKHHSKK